MSRCCFCNSFSSVTGSSWYKNREGLAVVIVLHQVRIDRSDFFRDQAILGHLPGTVFGLIVERHWTQSHYRVAGLAHVVDVLLEPRRGRNGPHLSVRAYEYRQSVSSRPLTLDTGHIGSVMGISYTDGLAFIDAHPAVAGRR